MAHKRERVVEDDISGPEGEAEAAGWLVWKMKITGIAGCPDRWHFRRGELVIIEYKRVGEDPDGRQVRRANELRGHGFKVHVVRDHDHARRLLSLGQYA